MTRHELVLISVTALVVWLALFLLFFCVMQIAGGS
jgi:hypothetical protein